MRVVDEIERLNEQVYKLEEKYCNNCQEFVCHFCHEMDERCEARTMKRLIYLEDAIDALEHKKDKNAKGDIGGFYNKIIQNDIDALKQLPSVQPEIIRCKDCKYWMRAYLSISGKHGCNVMRDYTAPDDYCFKAERKA